MSITEQRLKDYQLQMSIYAEQRQMLLASDVLDMIEQLQDDLKDDEDKIVKQIEDLRAEMEQFGLGDMPSDIIEIVKGGGADA